MSPTRPSVVSPGSATTSSRPCAASAASRYSTPKRASRSRRSTTIMRTCGSASSRLSRGRLPLVAGPTSVTTSAAETPWPVAHAVSRATWRSSQRAGRGRRPARTQRHARPAARRAGRRGRRPGSCQTLADARGPAWCPGGTSGRRSGGAHRWRVPTRRVSCRHTSTYVRSQKLTQRRAVHNPVHHNATVTSRRPCTRVRPRRMPAGRPPVDRDGAAPCGSGRRGGPVGLPLRRCRRPGGRP